MPAGAVSATVIHLMYQNGSLTTDDFSFQPYQPTGFNRPLVTLTFDDGWATHYTNGLPILNKYGLNGTFYLVSGSMNTPGSMTTAQISALQSAGNQLASHTVTHPDLTTLSAAALDNELSSSQSTLKSNFGGAFSDFASPYGAYNNATISAISKYYRSHRTVDTGYNGKTDTDMYRLRVQNIANTTTPAEVQGWINEAIRTNTWLIIVYHQIDSAPTAGEYSVTPANFDAQLAGLKNSGVTVATMTQAIAEVSPQLQ
jgi:peptidoglycan/xylan/chitin deacetylase (PgdA/CDA1 family)